MFHWDSTHQRYHGRGERTGTKWWNKEKHQWEGGGSNSKPGCHTRRNAADKKRKEGAKARYQREDGVDPDGMQIRAKARMEQNLRQKALNYFRVMWWEAYIDRTFADKLVDVAATNAWRAEKGQWALADAGASSSTSKWRPRSEERGRHDGWHGRHDEGHTRRGEERAASPPAAAP